MTTKTISRTAAKKIDEILVRLLELGVPASALLNIKLWVKKREQ